jgi:hypothetical protein
MRVLSQCSTGLGRRTRRKGAGRPGKHRLVVYTYNEAATITGVARRTLERLIAVGEGPAIIELSPRRRGILESDLINWLRKHRRASPGRCELRAAATPAASGATSTGAAAATSTSIPRPRADSPPTDRIRRPMA